MPHRNAQQQNYANTYTRYAADQVAGAAQVLGAILAIGSVLSVGFGLVFVPFLYPLFFLGLITSGALHGLHVYEQRGYAPKLQSGWAMAFFYLVIITVFVILTLVLIDADGLLFNLLRRYHWFYMTLLTVGVYGLLHVVCFMAFSAFLTGRFAMPAAWFQYVFAAVMLNPYIFMLLIVFGAIAFSGFGFAALLLGGVTLIIVVSLYWPAVYHRWFIQMAEDLADQQLAMSPTPEPDSEGDLPLR